MINSRDIDLLRADVAANCRAWQELCRAEGLNVLVTSTVRDEEYQAQLYAQGRSKPGSIVTNSPVPSFHSDKAGLAFDFCKNVKGHEYDDADFFDRAGALAKKVGFTWGGDWKSFPDRPHVQWDEGGEYSASDIIAGFLPPDMPLYGGSDEGENTPKRFNTIAEIEAAAPWAADTVRKLCDNFILLGGGATADENGYPTSLDMSMDMLRILVMNDRAGIYDI